MTIATVICSLGAFLSGVIAACYWYMASKVMVMPMWEQGGQLVPIPLEQGRSEWLHAVYLGSHKAGKLNKTAAIWTAVSVSLSGIASLISSFATKCV